MYRSIRYWPPVSRRAAASFAIASWKDAWPTAEMSPLPATRPIVPPRGGPDQRPRPVRGTPRGAERPQGKGKAPREQARGALLLRCFGNDLVHPAHAARRRRRGWLLFLLLDDHALGREQEARDRRGVLQR